MSETRDEPFIHFTPNVADVPARVRGGRLPAEALGRWERGEPPPDGAPHPVPVRMRPPVSAAAAAVAVAAAPRPGGRDPRSAQQDEWLNRIRRRGGLVDVVCLDGAQIRGRLVGFDTYALVVECDGLEMLVFKHAVRLLRPVVAPEFGGA